MGLSYYGRSLQLIISSDLLSYSSLTGSGSWSSQLTHDMSTDEIMILADSNRDTAYELIAALVRVPYMDVN